MAPTLIGVVHLGPLPGSPGFGGDPGKVISAALSDVRALDAAGFDAICVENFGDSPFYADRVPPETIAAMTRVITEIRGESSIPIGVNVLRNDAEASMSIAAVCECSFVRVNVLAGTMFTDQGPIIGRSAAVARLRQRLVASVDIYADVLVKHATPPPGVTLEQAAEDIWHRGGADALIVTGPATGVGADLAQAAALKKLIPAAPVFIGSGVTHETVGEAIGVADGVIVGTSVKVDGVVTNPVSEERAEALVNAAGRS